MAQNKASGKKIVGLIAVPVVALLLIALTLVVSGLVFVPAAIGWSKIAPVVRAFARADEIMVYIDASLSDAEARSVGSRINTLENVHRVQFVSREEALENFIGDHEDFVAFDGIQPEDLRHRFVVTVEDPGKAEQTAKELEKLDGIAEVGSLHEYYEIYQSAKQTAELTMILSAVIGMAVVFLIVVLAVVLELVLVIPKRRKHI